MPEFIASGSHQFKNRKYRFLILPRYKCDLHSIIKDRRIDTKNLLVIACQILDVLEHIHDKGYAHSDIKAENLMIGTCTYRKKRENYSSLSTDSGRDSNDDDDNDEDDNDYEENDDEDDDEDNESMNENTDSDFELDSGYKTPVMTKGQQQKDTNKDNKKLHIEFSGTNPVRSCRMERKYSMYQDMLSSHYLRPTRKINYFEDDDDDVKHHQSQQQQHKNATNKDENEWLAPSSISSYIRKAFLKSNNYYPRDKLNTTTHNNNDDGNSNDVDDAATADDYQTITEDRIFLIDYGLASKFINSSGVHHPFCMDQRRAHDGTIEFTSRDAHMGAHSRRSDLECLGYNLIYWCEGALPWKDEKLLTQPEQVHHMKEYFMADIQNVYKCIYGQSAPKFLHEFLQYVDNLAYHDRPNYAYCRQIFMNEMKAICNGIEPDMNINLSELKKKPLRKLQNGMEMSRIKLKGVKEMMKLHQKEPFKENGSCGGIGMNRISPKNLRSKSQKIPKKQRSKFSWTDVLSTDPDQIARQRAEKEIERDQIDVTPITSRYKGKPTYAIIAVQNRNKFKDKLMDCKTDIDGNRTNNDDDRIDGYTPAMMDVWRKRKSLIAAAQKQHCDKTIKADKKYSASQPQPLTTSTTEHVNKLSQLTNGSTKSSAALLHEIERKKILRRRKSGLRNNVRPSQKFVSFYQQSMVNKKRRNANSEFTPTDESSCGSLMSISDNSTGGATVASSPPPPSSTLPSPPTNRIRVIPLRNRKQYKNNSELMLSPSDDDSRDTTDYSPVKQIRKNRRKTKVLKKRLPRGGGK